MREGREGRGLRVRSESGGGRGEGGEGRDGFDVPFMRSRIKQSLSGVWKA